MGGLVLGSPILHFKGMRIMMFQLSGFYFRGLGTLPLAAVGFKDQDLGNRGLWNSEFSLRASTSIVSPLANIGGVMYYIIAKLNRDYKIRDKLFLFM